LRAFLAGHAAAHADHQARLARLDLPPLAELREHFLLRFLAHRAGVQQHHIRIAGVAGHFATVTGAQHIGHAR